MSLFFIQDGIPPGRIAYDHSPRVILTEMTVPAWSGSFTAGLNASLQWIAETTLDALWNQEEINRQKLLDILSGYDFIKIVGNCDGRKYAGIVSCLIEGISSDSAGSIFDQQGISVRTGLQCAPFAHQFLGTYPAGTIRFSVNYFTGEQDFEELIQALDYIEENL